MQNDRSLSLIKLVSISFKSNLVDKQFVLEDKKKYKALMDWQLAIYQQRK